MHFIYPLPLLKFKSQAFCRFWTHHYASQVREFWVNFKNTDSLTPFLPIFTLVDHSLQTFTCPRCGINLILCQMVSAWFRLIRWFYSHSYLFLWLSSWYLAVAMYSVPETRQWPWWFCTYPFLVLDLDFTALLVLFLPDQVFRYHRYLTFVMLTSCLPRSP